MNNYNQYFDLGELISKHNRNGLTEQEKTALEAWLKQSEHNRDLFSKLIDEAEISKQLTIFSVSGKEKSWDKIVRSTGFQKTKSTPVNFRQLVPYAAAILVLFATGLTFNKFFNKKGSARLSPFRQTDILPGSNKAILTLADGTKLILNDAKRGKIARQQSVDIDEIKNGQVVYSVEGRRQTIENNKVTINALTTPRGGQYEVVLQDGTKVWLNSASSLKYPAVFSGNERHVELTGEAYFEVVKNAARPFFVKTGSQTVKVLGTHFVINSYPDEKVSKTTLLEGRVSITDSNAGTGLTLRPGQQAVRAGRELRLISDADTEGAIAWKNGKFLFRDTDLQAIMRMLSRWYDVDVEYEGPVAERHFRGRISRNVPVSQVFEILKTSGINFTINGRKIIVKS